MTVASATETEDELTKLEAEHICPERALAQMQLQSATRNGLRKTA
jgi:hypothetical protein